MPKLFIGNIPHASSELDLQQWVESHGFQVESAMFIYDRETGKRRGFGFINLTEDSDVDKAIRQLNGRMLGGRALTVNKATPLTARTEHIIGTNSRVRN
jgi:RNA recognition motif-containing protein